MSGHVVALKSYDRKNLQQGTASLALQNEIFNLANLNHPNIIRLHEVIDSQTHVHLVTELCDGKNLYHLIKKNREKNIAGLPEEQARPILK